MPVKIKTRLLHICQLESRWTPTYSQMAVRIQHTITLHAVQCTAALFRAHMKYAVRWQAAWLVAFVCCRPCGSGRMLQ